MWVSLSISNRTDSEFTVVFCLFSQRNSTLAALRIATSHTSGCFTAAQVKGRNWPVVLFDIEVGVSVVGGAYLFTLFLLALSLTLLSSGPPSAAAELYR